MLKKILEETNSTFIIAEMSGNHNQSLERALEIVDAVAKTGANALKIQTYTADTMTIDCDKNGFVIEDKNSLWAGQKLYDLYQQAATPWEWHEAIFDRCKEHGMIGFSTPFDASSVDFLESLNVACYKIASFENVDIPLIKRVASTGKPVIMSTGMASLDELKESVQALTENGCKEIVLLKCTSSYPASPENTNLLTINDLKKQFPQCIIGLSDHTLGIGVSVASVVMGAKVIEKHFTLSRADGGVDSDFSMEPAEFKNLVDEVERARLAMGKVSYGPTEKEKKSLAFRRSIYAVEDIKVGDLISEKNIRCIRPGFGLAPKYYESLLGKVARCDIERGTPFNMELVD